MTRGTTPTNTFTTNIDLSGATIYVTYSQAGNTVVEKTGDDVTLNMVDDGNGNISYTVQTMLTQEDTLLFSSNLHVRMQIRAVFDNGRAVASQIIEVPVGDILKDGVIEYEP